ncbi:MAG: WD40 repeat domain-containing protein, partial [Candidatus Nanopelagicales bacterium]
MRRRVLTVVVACSALVVGGLAYAAPASAGPAGEYVYVAATPGGSILRLHDGATGMDNVLTGSEITSVSPDHVGLQVSRDGRRVAVTTYDDLDYSSRLHVYDRDTEVLDFLVSSGPDAGFSGLDWMPDSRHLLVAAQLPDGGTQDLWLVGLDRSRVTLPGTRGISGFDVSPGGELLAYSVPTTAGVPRVWLATIDGTARVDLGVAGESPQWSHDGSQLLATLPLYSPDKERVGSIVETFSPQGTGRTLYEATFLSGQVGFAWSRSHDGSVVGYHEGALSEIPLTAGATWTTVPTVSPSAAPAAPWSPPDTAAPTLTLPPFLAIEGTGVRFAWSNAAVRDPDIVAVRVALSQGMTPPATYAAGARRTTVLGRVYSTRFTGLVAGAVYSYAMWSMDASGNL